EGVPRAVQLWLVSPHQWKVGRFGNTGNVSVARRVNSDAVPLVPIVSAHATATQVSRVIQRRPVSPQLGYEYVVTSPAILGLDGILQREVGRVGPAGNVSIALCIHRYAPARIVAASAQIGRIYQR